MSLRHRMSNDTASDCVSTWPYEIDVYCNTSCTIYSTVYRQPQLDVHQSKAAYARSAVMLKLPPRQAHQHSATARLHQSSRLHVVRACSIMQHHTVEQVLFVGPA